MLRSPTRASFFHSRDTLLIALSKMTEMMVGPVNDHASNILLNLNSSRSVIAISKLCRALSRATVCQKSAQTDDH
jgi:hypothetical protein